MNEADQAIVADPVDAFMNRLATAPISWGICEVPGWGAQLPVDRVLTEMKELGFTQTELGSDGWLPTDTEELKETLERHELGLLAAFIPLVLHDPAWAEESRARAHVAAQKLADCGATLFNTSTVTTWDWGPRRELTSDEWNHTMAMLTELDDIIGSYGLTQVLHTHVDTIVETREEIQRVVDGCNVSFVLDTAHFGIGGYAPDDFCSRHADRVGLVHLKDLDQTYVGPLNRDEMKLMAAVQSGIFPTIGRGGLNLGRVLQSLTQVGYDGWYVLEQDVAISGGTPKIGEGPITQVRNSVNALRQLVTESLTA